MKHGFGIILLAIIAIPCIHVVYDITDEEKQIRGKIGEKEYDNWCPGFNGVVEEVAPGYKIRYLCDTHAAKIDSKPLWEATSIKECANLCREKESCVSSVWKRDGACFLSNQGQATRKVKGFVYMVPYKDQDDQKVCANSLVKYNKEKEDLEEKPQECREKNPGNDRGGNGGFKCPEYDGKTLSTSGGDYQIYCNRADDAGYEDFDLAYLNKVTPSDVLNTVMPHLNAIVLYGGHQRPQTHGQRAIFDLTTTELRAFLRLDVSLSEDAKAGAVLIGFKHNATAFTVTPNSHWGIWSDSKMY